jgi:hypothetical protein
MPAEQSDYPATFSVALDHGIVLDVAIDRSPRDFMIKATESKDGDVVGKIEASQQALQRDLGLAQRVHQAEV